MADCCQNKGCELEALRQRQSSTLKAVLAINLAMFVIELTAGLWAGSVALLADSLDMLGDAMVYGFSSLRCGALRSTNQDERKNKAAMPRPAIMSGQAVAVSATELRGAKLA